MRSTCRRCHGQGKIITTPCRQCSGKGTTTRTQTVNIQVPAGVENGQTVRVPVGHSEAYVELKVLRVQSNNSQLHKRIHTLTQLLQVQDSDIFTRDGFDIHSDAGVSFTQAILGGEVTIRGLNGQLVVKVSSHDWSRDGYIDTRHCSVRFRPVSSHIIGLD